jgi:glycosyltransferase involved in cell wall biosynthesis
MVSFFSIIIPTYNRCEMVIKCVLSLQGQSFNNWECIIVNDGSTDNTQQEIEKLCQTDSRITLLNQPNSERAIARNNGAKLATGEFYIFLDSDDFFENNHLQELYNHIKIDKQKNDMYFTNGAIIINNVKEVIVKKEVPLQLPIDYFLNNSVIPARVCLHHTIFNEFQFDPRAIVVEDTVLWTEIIDNKKIKYLPLTSVMYQIHDDNSVNIQKNNAYYQRLNGLKVLFYNKKVGEKISFKIKRKHLNRCYYGISDFFMLQKNQKKAIFWILKSILLYPEIDLKFKLARLLFLVKFVSHKTQHPRI